ncbi:MAG TPA: hypothetical protein PK230_04175 [Chitinophagales bacterium]|nr:hypothetical protein [Chitinophagales bacterium]
MCSLDNNYKTVVESIRMLSTPYNEQKALLPDFVYVPYDVLSGYEAAFGLLPQLIEDHRFSFEAIAAQLRLYNQVYRKIIGWDEDIEDFDSVGWNKIREMAKRTLMDMGEAVIPPDPNWV